MSVFKNFKLLKADMEEKGWVIEAFPFNYKSNEYIILAKLYQEGMKKQKYALLETEILKSNNSNENIIIPVNSNGFMTETIGLRKFREFFNINYSENLGDILQQFNNYFSKFIPTQINPNKSKKLKRAMISSLSKNDSQDPNKIYCFAVQRHSEKKRTRYNDNKSRLLRPNLYSKFKEDLTISFYYSTDSKKDKSDEEIIKNFSK